MASPALPPTQPPVDVPFATTNSAFVAPASAPAEQNLTGVTATPAAVLPPEESAIEFSTTTVAPEPQPLGNAVTEPAFVVESAGSAGEKEAPALLQIEQPLVKPGCDRSPDQPCQPPKPKPQKRLAQTKFELLTQAFQTDAQAPDPTAPNPSESEDVAVQVQKIMVLGSTILTAQDIEPLVKPLQGRAVTIADLETLADQITQIYLDRGFLTSRALLDKQGIANGVVPIRVLEDTLEEIQVTGLRRLKPNYLRSRIQRAAGTPINVGRLEDQLRLLRADPLFSNVEATLRVGSEVGKTVLVVRATEANPFSGNAFINNYSPPSVGSEQFGTNLAYRNLTGNGDLLSGGYRRSTTGGSEVIDLGYQIPVSPSEATVQLRASWSNSEITQAPFDALGIKADAELYEVNFRQPLIRSSREELALSLGFAYQNGQTFLFNDQPFSFGIGPDANGVSRTSVIKLGQEYVRRDVGGAWALRSLFSLGTALFDATQNPGDDPDGQFFAWLGQAQRVQRLSDRQLLIVQADVQLTPDSLLPSQQFVIGGGQSVRGYRQNARSGDNGFRVSVEDRITVQADANGSPTLQIAPFIEMGSVWNVSGNPNLLPDRNFLASIGLGLLWQPVPQLNLRVDYGLPLISLSDRGNNLQDSGVYFSVNYQF